MNYTPKVAQAPQLISPFLMYFIILHPLLEKRSVVLLLLLFCHAQGTGVDWRLLLEDQRLNCPYPHKYPHAFHQNENVKKKLCHNFFSSSYFICKRQFISRFI